MIEIITNLLGGMCAHPTITNHVAAIKRKVYTPIADLQVEGVSTDEPITLQEAKERELRPIKPGQKWTDVPFGACWMHLTGRVPAQGEGKHLVVLTGVGGEGLGVVDDQPVDIVTPLMSVPDFLQPPSIGKRVINWRATAHEGDEVDVWVDCGNNGITGHFLITPKLCYARLAVLDDELRDYYYDYLTLAVLLATGKKNARLSSELRKELIEVLSASFACFRKGDRKGAKESLAAYYDKSNTDSDILYTLIGHAHLDLAWLWPERESHRKAVRTFTNALSLMVKCPQFVFGASQAQMFDWVRHSHPDLFVRLQQAARAGQLELQGGMWVESDCNVPSGESLIRQFVYGDRFFNTYFGKSSDVVWLPDAFGFPYTLPQIIRGVGKHSFATTKLYWNATNTFPYQSFYWVAPDGSEVLSHLTPERTYCNDGTPLAVAKAERRNTQKETGHALLIYGVGDGGGGPSEGHVQIACRARALRGIAPSRMASAGDFFADLAKASSLPRYNGELYLEFHQGTYTSQVKNKQYNRQCENAMHTLEWLSAVYGKRPLAMDEMWQKLLLGQFHDILPGSGIGRVHRESQAQLEELLAQIQRDTVDVVDAPKGYSMLNPSPFASEELTEHHGKLYLASAEPYATATFAPGNSTASISDDEIENDRVKIRFCRGEIVSFVDKQTGKEYCAKALGRLSLYVDKPKKYDAWNLDIEYLESPKRIRYIDSKFYCEATRAVAEIRFAFGKSHILQKVSLGRGTKVVFETHVDWHETHSILRADFYPTVYAPTAQFDIQFGHIDRSTGNETSVERAQYEVCGHKYVSVAQGKDIFAVYSRDRYGWRVKDGCISLALLRAPVYPDPDCDRGSHVFTYAFDIPVDQMACVAQAYNFNYPMLIMDKAATVAPLCPTLAPNLILETIKPADEGEGIVLRIYERAGQKAAWPVQVEGYTRFWQTDMEEKNAVPIAGDIRFAPYQIHTILCKP